MRYTSLPEYRAQLQLEELCLDPRRFRFVRYLIQQGRVTDQC
jgi:hypothetical protein